MWCPKELNLDGWRFKPVHISILPKHPLSYTLLAGTTSLRRVQESNLPECYLNLGLAYQYLTISVNPPFGQYP